MVNTNKNFAKKVISWYLKNKRSLPFRKSKDPYKIWLSEIMLQQTQVKTVIPYYTEWTKKFPTLKTVSLSNIDSLLKLWEGLGYYKRCINFYEASKIVIKNYNGKIPDKKKELLVLPGVGEYTASAILSIAFNKPYPVLDGNVKRVMSRIIGINKLSNLNLRRINRFLDQLICRSKPGDFNQGLMEIGALICRPINPRCTECPLNENCYAFAKGNPESFPAKTIRKSKPQYDVVVAIIWRDNKFYIQKRQKDKMLGGLWEFPGGIVDKGENPRIILRQKVFKECGTDLNILKKAGIVDHAFSHFTIRLCGYFCSEKKLPIKESANREWIKKENIKDYTFPKANHKLFRQLEIKNWDV